MYKALVIGCGNIGAGYDLHNGKILTHTKALHLDKRFTLAVYDVNKSLTNKISDKYSCEVIKNIESNVLVKFDCVCICTPTDTHYHFLKTALRARVKLIICEKPISNSSKELRAAKAIYNKGNSKVLVNYIRRFQPAYLELKQTISNLLKKESLTNVTIRYQRGFVNNCSHAFDTIEYIMDCKFILTNIKTHNKVYDHFANDPTFSLQATWNKANVNITGLSNVKFTYFEIDLYFEYCRISIKNAGEKIEIYTAEKEKKRFQPLKLQDHLTHEDCLKDYMKYVINYAQDLLNKKDTSDNFLTSVGLNLRMLNYLNN